MVCACIILGVNGISESLIRSELDREQFALVEAKFRGLGFPPSDPSNGWEGPCDWYGGQIQQIVRLTRAKEGKFSLTLCRMQKTRSHRFARYHGSRHILQMKIVDTRGDLEEEKKFLQQNFILCGRIFVPFSVKDGKVYMLEIDEGYGRGSSDLEGDDHRYALDAFVMCHNPIALNMGQVCSSLFFLLGAILTPILASRQMGLSN